MIVVSYLHEDAMFDVVMKATNDSGLVVGEVTNNFRVLWEKAKGRS